MSISASASTHPSAIALRYLQRKAIMMDPHWHRGHYYTKNVFPRFGMKLARSVTSRQTRSTCFMHFCGINCTVYVPVDKVILVVAFTYMCVSAILCCGCKCTTTYTCMLSKLVSLRMRMRREIGTITYRSGPEWDERFGRQRIKASDDPSLCPYFMIENYLEYQGEQFCTRYDPNSLIYISKVITPPSQTKRKTYCFSVFLRIA